MSDPNLMSWKIAGIVATALVVLAFPLHFWRTHNLPKQPPESGAPDRAAFVGSQQCRSCHKPEYDKWLDSHHRWAMAEATEETVSGDFDDARFEHFGVTSKFFRRDGKFFVRTPGPGGKLAEFEITHTFGWYPLQQYLIPFPGGRLQCLPIAWDVEKERWYHLYPDAPVDPADWLYWVNNAQNWNGMCAECHSTDLRKNYDIATDSYRTTWSEISVGCEACHGPGSTHVQWAELPAMGRPEVENFALPVRTAGLTSRQQVELCAPCHSRRMSLDDNIHRHADFLDYGVPQLLSPGMYYTDGQILDEVYVYGSFMQSKMYDRDVRCSDCHDVHSIRRIRDGNDLCLQCHRAAVYDTKDHHFHKQANEPGEPIRSPTGQVLFAVGSGARCEQCHMPGRRYMGVDYRPDHSFRIPRPDLTLTHSTPNACNRCHGDKTAQWSVETLGKWYGQRKRPHYGTVLSAGRLVSAAALTDLVRLAEDRLYPAIVRATALSLLAAYPAEDGRRAITRALSDETALLRYTAVRHLNEPPESSRRLKLLAPLLYDPVRAVRIEAARELAEVEPGAMPADTRKQFEKALTEYRKAMERTADFAPSRHNLGNLCAVQGDVDCAVAHYRKAVQIDDHFYPAKVNLATLYNRQGNNDEAETLLREVVAAEPELHEAKYSLGLLLAEMKKFEEAGGYMSQAAREMPDHSRAHYNLGLLRQRLRQDDLAEAALVRALELEPENREYLYALAVFYLQRQRLDEAGRMAQRMLDYPGSQAMGKELEATLRRLRSKAGKPVP